MLKCIVGGQRNCINKGPVTSTQDYRHVFIGTAQRADATPKSSLHSLCSSSTHVYCRHLSTEIINEHHY